MTEPDLVADCYAAMAKAVDIPVTVKCRLGVDDQVVEDTLPEFIEKVSTAGCKHFIVHARKAWLKGLSPKENRDVPPLNYELVRAMKARFPHLEIVLNGGLNDLNEAMAEAESLDGIMFGRAAYHDPWMLSRIDSEVFGEVHKGLTREEVIRDLIGYAKSWEQGERSPKAIVRHIMGLYARQPGARLWRRTLSEGLSAREQPSAIIAKAYDVIRGAQDAYARADALDKMGAA